LVLGEPHLHGYQVVISRGLKCGLSPIRVTLLKPGIPPETGFLQNESHLPLSRLDPILPLGVLNPFGAAILTCDNDKLIIEVEAARKTIFLICLYII
jgi:hypothetical protein